MTRKEANNKLLKEFELLIDKYPEQRFGQIICNYFFPEHKTTDLVFYEESIETLNKIKKNKDTETLINIFKNYSLNEIRDILIDAGITDETFPHLYHDIEHGVSVGKINPITVNKDRSVTIKRIQEHIQQEINNTKL